MLTRFVFIALAALSAAPIMHAETGYDAWLRYPRLDRAAP